MAQFLLALYKADDEKLSAEQTRQVWADVNALGDRLTQAGVFVFQGGLDGGSAAATVVRRSGGEFVLTDGPYAETKEHLAGFWIIDVPNRDAALDWAKQTAVAQQRPIEVRPFFHGDLDDAIEAHPPGGQ